MRMLILEVFEMTATAYSLSWCNCVDHNLHSLASPVRHLQPLLVSGMRLEQEKRYRHLPG